MSEFGAFRPIVALAVHDKPVHFVLYFVLGLTLAWAREKSVHRLPHWGVVGLGFAYGAVDELHQAFVPNRMPSVSDWVADALGVLAGYAVLTAAFGIQSRRRARQAAQ